jgi:hypothetical protein
MCPPLSTRWVSPQGVQDSTREHFTLTLSWVVFLVKSCPLRAGRGGPLRCQCKKHTALEGQVICRVVTCKTALCLIDRVPEDAGRARSRTDALPKLVSLTLVLRAAVVYSPVPVTVAL